jgi:hypothetical protein
MNSQINPYDASQSDTPRNVDSCATADNREAFDYSARLDWADRQALLRSVGPMRIAVVAAAVTWSTQLYQQLTSWYAAIRGEFAFFDSAFGVLTGLMGIAALLIGTLSLYGCWLHWRYAQSWQEVAGGRNADLQSWSGLTLRIARLSAVIAILGVVIQASSWLVSRFSL